MFNDFQEKMNVIKIAYAAAVVVAAGAATVAVAVASTVDVRDTVTESVVAKGNSMRLVFFEMLLSYHQGMQCLWSLFHPCHYKHAADKYIFNHRKRHYLP